MRIFFAGPLTDLIHKSKTKEFYKKMAAAAKLHGFDSFWAFLNGTDPEKNPDVPADVVYATDLDELGKSDFMIAYVGEPTTGTGQEIEYAREHNIPVYLMYEKDKRISRMVLGSPNIKGIILFENQQDALDKLTELLEIIKENNAPVRYLHDTARFVGSGSV